MADNALAVPRKLWEHPDPQSTDMYKFMREVGRKENIDFKSFKEFYKFSITHRAKFFGYLFSHLPIIYTGTYTRVVDESLPIDALPRWFEGVSLNFAENMLYCRSLSDEPSYRGTWAAKKFDHRVAVTEIREGNVDVRHVTWKELRLAAARMAAALKERGLRKGDRVVVVGANSVDTLVVLLGTTWLGGLFSSSSTDMGPGGILQRTVQVNPKFVFFDDATVYNGTTTDLREKMAAVVEGLVASCDQFQGLVSIPRFANPSDVSSVARAETLASFLSAAPPSVPDPPFEHVAFHEPFLICYSSGTTGIPKAIVHSVGGVVLSTLKEGRLHEEFGPDGVGLQFTTTGWIMYLVSVTQLLHGGRAVFYDGSPFRPDPCVLLRIIEEQRVTKLGTSPRWMFELSKRGIAPRDVADLSSLMIVTSTGMVLSDQLFEWFYDVGFPKKVHLANLSGGTDIAGCFGMENPLDPVYVGGTQGGSLGTPVAIYDSSLPDGSKGVPIPDGEPGELVAPNAFPNLPCLLWGDTPGNVAGVGPRYRSSYFGRFEHAWAQGDFCSVHPVTGSISFLGRADGVLNPSGVRFGSAEIYAVIERHFAERVADSLCVGQRRPGDPDEKVLLFLLMKPGEKFTAELVKEVNSAIARDLTKRHVPAYVMETPEIPTTVNLKKVELPVKQIVSGKKIKPSSTLLNPECLEFYYQFVEVEKVVPKAKL